jgi:hypothetical protein
MKKVVRCVWLQSTINAARGCGALCKWNSNLLDDGGDDPCKIRAEKDNRNKEKVERHHERQQECTSQMSDIATTKRTGRKRFSGVYA